MSSHRCADPTFGINHQAQAVLALLAGKPLDIAPFNDKAMEYEAYVKTFPWYNGREAGFALVLFREPEPHGTCLILACAECKSSDDIFIEEWQQEKSPSNGPTLVTREEALGFDRADDARVRRQTFSEGRIGAVVNYIYDRMAKFYAEKEPKSAIERLIEDD